MNKKLYVGNLSYDCKQNDLLELFQQQGEVGSVNLITDQHTGRIKGFGFVEMADSEGAQAAQENLNGSEFMGRALKVDMAKERTDRDSNRSRY